VGNLCTANNYGELRVTAALISLAAILGAFFVVFVRFFTSPAYVKEFGPITFVYTTQAILLWAIASLIAGFLIYRVEHDRKFLLRLFLAALVLRLIVASGIFAFNLQSFFGGDVFTYDWIACNLLKGWQGDALANVLAGGVMNRPGAGYGMVYYVTGIYLLVGRNMYAVQLLNSVLGAATVPLIYIAALMIFENRQVARLSAGAVAFVPSLILWSSQGLKDGPIMFFIAVVFVATLKLSKRFSLGYLLLLLCALGFILTLRFYIFYISAAAIVGTLLIGTEAIAAQSFFRQFILLVLITFSLGYVCMTGYIQAQIQQYGTLEAVNVTRQDLANSANSGYAKGYDVSTMSGAASTVPVGFLYLLLAPFPWQLNSLRQAITLPEMLFWWTSLPLLVLGLWHSTRYRFRQVLPILIFTTLLSIAYSVVQGNVGTAYRQRAQLLIFYFILSAAGYVLLKEKYSQKVAEKSLEADRIFPGLIN